MHNLRQSNEESFRQLVHSHLVLTEKAKYHPYHMKKKLLFWVPTVILLFGMVGSAVSYFADIPGTIEAFNQLGYPGYVLYFNGMAKILGAIAIVAPVSPILKEWAYAGYLFIILLATQAIYMTMPEMIYPIGVFYVFWGLSYWQYRAQHAA